MSEFKCKAEGCNENALRSEAVCSKHYSGTSAAEPVKDKEPERMSARYPKYYKFIGGMQELDVYAVHKIFNIEDPSGAIQHASKKLLLSGVRTGGKSKFDDIREARDTLNRWLELNKTTSEVPSPV